MFLKFVVYCIAAYLVLRLFRGFLRYLAAPASPRGVTAQGARRRGGAAVDKSAQMVRCQACGMFVTQGSAIVDDGKCFCSSDCAAGQVHRS